MNTPATEPAEHPCSCTVDFADGTYRFRLKVEGAIELEEKCDSPFTVIYHRLSTGTHRPNDIRETIRLGLIGGGLEPVKALALVRKYIDDRPLQESALLAHHILGGLLYGFERKAPPKPAIDPTPPGVPVAAADGSSPPAAVTRSGSAAVSPATPPRLGPISSRLRGN